MKFGVREIANVVFKAKADTRIGSSTFKAGQPVLYIDSATTSTIEGAATTVYAQGGRGNTRLIAWEGEKTLTFTVEDALLSPIGFSILSGAGLFKDEDKEVHVHTTSQAYRASLFEKGKNLLSHNQASWPPAICCVHGQGSRYALYLPSRHQDTYIHYSHHSVRTLSFYRQGIPSVQHVYDLLSVSFRSCQRYLHRKR